MIDKQIIIDGVDVSGCDYFNFTDEHYCDECSSEFGCAVCDERTNCYYKQLKIKEQECEELKKIINEAKNSKLDLKSFLVGEAVQNEYEQQLDQLKQTLAEIKEILKEICMEECSFDWNKTNKKHCGDYDCRYGQILQKIKQEADKVNNG